MSQMPALARPTARAPRRPEQARPRLRVVTTAPRPSRRLPFVMLCSVVLTLGLLALLFLNMQLATGSYALHDLQSRATALQQDEEHLREQLAVQESPALLARRAGDLGMVPGNSPAFLRLPDGQVLGVPQAASAPSPTTVKPGPSPSASASSSDPSSSGSSSSDPSSKSSDSSPSASSSRSSSAPDSAARSSDPGAGRSNPRATGSGGESTGQGRTSETPTTNRSATR